jgi:hypothetical protein
MYMHTLQFHVPSKVAVAKHVHVGLQLLQALPEEV